MSNSNHGGKRPGAGRKPGKLNQKTLDAMKVKEAYQERIRDKADALFNAQLSLATGTQMLFVIKTDSKGNRRKPELVTDVDTISRFLDENEGASGTLDDGSEYYFMTTNAPDSRTISDMLDRAMGKPDQSMKFEDVTEKRPLKGLDANELRKALLIKRGKDDTKSS